MGEMDALEKAKTSKPRALDACATPRHNWRSASWRKKPSFSPLPSPIAEASSSKDSEESLCDDNEEGEPEEAASGSCPLFLDSQGRNMRLLCPSLQALSISRHSDKESTSRSESTNIRNEMQVKIDLNCVEDVINDEDNSAEFCSGVQENEVEEESEDRISRCDKECSQILPYLFLGSRTVAQNLATLHRCRITHILNCVGFACAEHFPNNFFYKTLWLQDSPSEDLTCILYDVFDYIEEVQEQVNSRLFVHCCQGVSRSAALVIAYLMWKEHRSFDDAFAFVKAARCIASPNIGFVVQLMQWQSKIQNPPSENISPRMYRMAPHSPYAPLHLVAKLVAKPSILALDSRGVFIIQLPRKLYVWRGKKSDIEMAAVADRSAFQLVRYEHVQGPFVCCDEGFESPELCKALGKDMLGEISISFEVGEKLVAAYDMDYQLFRKAKIGGYVPPAVGMGGTICLPAKYER